MTRCRPRLESLDASVLIKQEDEGGAAPLCPAPQLHSLGWIFLQGLGFCFQSTGVLTVCQTPCQLWERAHSCFE